MRLLLDTHILLWAVADTARLGSTIQTVLAAPHNEIFVSAASAWEISIKQALGRLSFPLDRFDEILDRLNAQSLPISIGHAVAAGSLPRHHDDPFDRLLIAQAQLEAMALITTDALLHRYEVAILGRA